MKNNIKNLTVFVLICTVVTLMLALTNSFTLPVIEKNQSAAANQALTEVMPEGQGFEILDLAAFTLPSTVVEAYKETSDKGYVVKLVTSGYGSNMTIMCGVDFNGVVTGAVCLSSNETLGKEKTYGENFLNKDAAGVDGVDVIGGATKTTAAYKNAVKDAINSAIIFGGGSVDVRTPEQIIADNLSSAFPQGEGEFEKVFLVEDFENVDAVYSTKNGTGFVFVMGEEFVGVTTDGLVVNGIAENSDFLASAVEALVSVTYEEIDVSVYEELSKTVVSAVKVSNGNYVVETKGAGYGIKGGNEYHPASGEYIVVRVSMTPDGKIIDCITVSQAETKGLGDACDSQEFYGQFVDKTQENYTQIDAIGGATMTTDGYKQAIERAFVAVNILKEGE